jgi:deoxyribodipyrimidine photolyase-related protein
LLRRLPKKQTADQGHNLMPAIRNLIVVLGDQLNRDASAWDGFDPAQDRAWMCEAQDESTHTVSAKQRIVVFLSAMRHFANALRAEGVPLDYREMAPVTLAQALTETLAATAVSRVVLTQPGEWRVEQSLRATAQRAGVPLDVREDRHFLCSDAEFAAHARGRKQLRMEYFYREMRQRHRILMEDGKPAGGEWNYDAENRAGFGAKGPGFVPAPTRFPPDAVTQSVIELVNTQFSHHPGSLHGYGWPATRVQALQVLDVFVRERLPQFGLWQDAMWEGQPWLYHAHISAALNLKLLNPREVLAAAEAEYRAGRVPLAGAEGFVRQILGWREYVRGVYRLGMPGYAERNELAAHAPLPDWYWTGDVPMRCLRDAITQTLEQGYAHHIQRLMVTGLYALMLGVEPKQVHAWYLGVYVDAVEWVELPNTLGMSQYADGGVMASKPYVATGKYIERMSDHCSRCRFKPALRTGPQACPYTTLYWDFLLRHETRFAPHPRMALQVRNLARIGLAERQAITLRAAALQRGDWDAER